ncbi:MAG: 16S rRNA (guanine(966)-N(2))-methyltransferase RsmD [Magnetococcus sp. MYC-9]
MVRISGGQLRGRRLHVPTEGWIRPTMGRVRESLFSMLARHIREALVLDLYAGCGLLGLEAISRGARHSFFVDLEWKAVQFIEKNVTLCGLPSRSTLLQGDVRLHSTLERVKQLANPMVTEQHPGFPSAGGGACFDLVFLDPPYRQGLIAGTLAVLEQTCLLAPGAIIVVEQEAEAAPEPSAPWPLLQNRRYGNTRLLLWQTPPQESRL